MVEKPARVQSASLLPLAHLQLQSRGQLSLKSALAVVGNCSKGHTSSTRRQQDSWEQTYKIFLAVSADDFQMRMQLNFHARFT